MNEPRRSNDLFDNQQAEIDDDLARYGEDLYQAGVRLRKTRPAEAKRLFELAAHAAPDNAPLQQQVREQLASLGASGPARKGEAMFNDPVPLPVKSSGSDTVESYLDRMAENLFQRAEQLKQKDPAAAANLYVRVLGMTLNRDPLHAKADAALKALGR